MNRFMVVETDDHKYQIVGLSTRGVNAVLVRAGVRTMETTT